jgi:hypothetical protein
VAGVKDAQEPIKKLNGLVNPEYTGNERDFTPHKIEFDIAVTIENGKETKGGLGIFIAGIGLGAQGSSDSSNTVVSRIKFTIPVHLPAEYK